MNRAYFVRLFLCLTDTFFVVPVEFCSSDRSDPEHRVSDQCVSGRLESSSQDS